jgi:hypothetical protein
LPLLVLIVFIVIILAYQLILLRIFHFISAKTAAVLKNKRSLTLTRLFSLPIKNHEQNIFHN